MVYVTLENFKEIIEKNELVVLDFFANWCAPCRMLGEVLEEIQNNNPDLVIGKVNVDEEGELARSFNIRSIPQVYIIKNGKVVKNISGFVSYDELLGAVRSC